MSISVHTGISFDSLAGLPPEIIATYLAVIARNNEKRK